MHLTLCEPAFARVYRHKVACAALALEAKNINNSNVSVRPGAIKTPNKRNRTRRAAAMAGENDHVLREELDALRLQHRKLDDEIIALEAGFNADQLAIRRLKKQKLYLKEQIQKIEDQLLPDIIA